MVTAITFEISAASFGRDLENWIFLRIRRGMPAQRILDTLAVGSGLICRAGMPL
jgi:hypothetical protein